ncbi:hypothetical protein SDC9_161426 [bioreactor metagenome]|uniref:Uncharacterized protein n=1 Tax=bioreactor metagenome TaxID=1076179 RepID=A0A645FJF9_9ZZZZ
MRGLERVNSAKAFERGRLLVDRGVVFHGAAAKRIESVVDAVDLLLKLGIMPAHVGFAQLRQVQGRFAQQRVGDCGLRHGGFRDHVASSSRNAPFKR